MIIPVFKLSDSEALLCNVLADCGSASREEAARRLIEELGDEQAFDLAQVNGVNSIVAHVLMNAYALRIFPCIGLDFMRKLSGVYWHI